MKYKNDLISSVSKLEKICEMGDPDWSLKATEYKTSLEKLISDPKNYKESNPVFYDLCEKIFGENKNSKELNDLLNKYGIAKEALGALDKYSNVVNWVAYCLQYNALVDAFQTEDRVKLLLKEYVKDGIGKIEDVFGATVVKNATVYIIEGLGISIAAASWLGAALESYKIGWSLAQAITENQTNIECRELARAYFYLEEALKQQVEADVNDLKKEQSY